MKYVWLAVLSTTMLACSEGNGDGPRTQGPASHAQDDDSWFWGNLREASDDAKALARFYQGAVPEHPEVVQLMSEDQSCTGTLARTKEHDSRKVIVSAAHCFVWPPKPIHAYFGKGTNPDAGYDFTDRVATLPVIARVALAQKPLERAKTGIETFSDASDVALFVLAMDVPDSIPRSMISPNAPEPPQSCEVTGFGNRDGKSGWQRAISVTLDSIRDFNLITKSENPKDPTQFTGPGDSGGPLWCDVNGEKLQVAVTSGGDNRARLDVVYAKINEVIDVVEKGGTEEDLAKYSWPSMPKPKAEAKPAESP